jgi:hypothetical protein
LQNAETKLIQSKVDPSKYVQKIVEEEAQSHNITLSPDILTETGKEDEKYLVLQKQPESIKQQIVQLAKSMLGTEGKALWAKFDWKDSYLVFSATEQIGVSKDEVKGAKIRGYEQDKNLTKEMGNTIEPATDNPMIVKIGGKNLTLTQNNEKAQSFLQKSRHAPQVQKEHGLKKSTSVDLER